MGESSPRILGVPPPALVKGFATPEIGIGMGGIPVSTTLTSNVPCAPTNSWPEGWSLHSGFSIPGIKSGATRRRRKWLTKLRNTIPEDLHQADISEARIDAIAETLDEDGAIDDIMAMLDVSSDSSQAFIFIGRITI
jgi:hypothetical protein